MIPADEMYEGDTVVTPKPAEKRHSSATPRSTDGIRLDSIEDAIAAIKAGQAVVVVDDEDRENEGDMIFAASAANAQLCAFMIRYTSGFICVGMEGEVVITQDLFAFRQEGDTTRDAVKGVFEVSPLRPGFAARAAYYGVEDALAEVFRQ